MAEVFAETHVMVRPDEPAVGFVISSESSPGMVEIIAWAEGRRIRVRFAGEEGVHVGAALILAAGQAMQIARGQKAPEGRIITNGVGRG